MSPSGVSPWKPATMAMAPESSASMTRPARTSWIRAFVWLPSETIPACAPVKDIAS
jgi:hypothetical protein